MSTRMDKYKDTYLEGDTRTKRNRNIYTKIEDEDIEKINLTNNISVIDADTSNLDIEKLKTMLDSKKKEKREVPTYDVEMEEEEELEDTKEYDLKKVIDKAHRTKTSDYDKDRFQKLRSDEYEILANLDIKKEEVKEELTEEETTLINLIKTIDENALKKSEQTDDLLGDLKGDDDTEVLEPIPIDDNTETLDITVKKPTILEEIEKTKQLSKSDIYDKLAETIEEEEEETTQQPVNTNTFYTGDVRINEDDLDDFKDLRKEMKMGSLIIKILVILLVLILLALGIYFLNNYMDLGLF